MADTIRNVAIITKINNAEAETAAERITNLLITRKIRVYSILPLTLENSTSVVTPEDLKNIDLDLAFAVGGDGTTLKAFRIIPCNTPLVSMNVGGHRGVLSEVGIDAIESAIDMIVTGRYFHDFRLRIQASINGNKVPPALNDIVFTRVNLTKTPILSIKLMDDEIKQRMDGIIISTATGSTAHSYSMGGPVVYEDMGCLILNPIASVNRMPGLVIPALDIEIKSTHDAQLIIDGQEVFKVTAGQSVRISRFSMDAEFIRLKKRGMRQLTKLGF
ncbi:MAG: NAD(+)/NADH kinase [Nitrososphaeraceae archaeon]